MRTREECSHRTAQTAAICWASLLKICNYADILLAHIGIQDVHLFFFVCKCPVWGRFLLLYSRPALPCKGYFIWLETKRDCSVFVFRQAQLLIYVCSPVGPGTLRALISATVPPTGSTKSPKRFVWLFSLWAEVEKKLKKRCLFPSLYRCVLLQCFLNEPLHFLLKKRIHKEV